MSKADPKIVAATELYQAAMEMRRSAENALDDYSLDVRPTEEMVEQLREDEGRALALLNDAFAASEAAKIDTEWEAYT